MILTRHKIEGKYYAVKVLNKKLILTRNEAKHIMSERNVLLKTLNHPFLVGLHYCFQTAEKLYFVLDYVNGGEVCSWCYLDSLIFFKSSLSVIFPPTKNEDFW